MRRFKKAVTFAALISFIFLDAGYSQEGVTPPPAQASAENAGEVFDAASTEIPYVTPGNVTVNFRDADIRAVLNYFSEVSGVDIVPAPDVTGTVTLRLTNKPWQVALDIIMKNYGFAYEREGDIIRVVTISSLKLEELSTEVIHLNYTSAEDAQEAIRDMLTERGKLTYDNRINAIVVTDIATNIYKIRRVIESLDRKTPQIMIEAKIIETTLSKDEKLGIDWNFVIAAHGASRPITLPFTNWGDFPGLPDLRKFYPWGQQAGTTAVQTGGGGATQQSSPGDFSNVPSGTPAFPFAQMEDFTYGTLDFTQFSAVMQYMKARSDTDIISSPRITTLNNKGAKMFVGKVFNYIAEIEQKEDTGGSERWTYKIEKEEIGIRLLVTPHINANGDIEVELKPEIKDVVGYQQVTQWFSLPVFTTREAETQVMVRDGDTIFIGGLIKDNVKEADRRLPFIGDLFGDIPFLGSLVKYTIEQKDKVELVFFLTVHVVKDLDELTRVAIDDLKDVEVPMELPQLVETEIGGNPGENVKVINVPGNKPAGKKYKPIFDFRKKKKAEPLIPAVP